MTDTDITLPPLVDPLSDTLHAMRLQGTLYCRATLRGDWGVEIPQFDGLMGFIAVTSGRAWFEMEGVRPQWLERGCLALMPHGTAHRLSHAPGARSVPLGDLPVERITERYEVLNLGETGDVTQGTYGVVRFDDHVAQKVLAHLPKAIFNHHWDMQTDGWMDSTMRYISREAANLKPGGETVLTRLADILVIQAIRAWLDTAPEARQGWLAAMRDPKIGRALTAIHRHPDQPWTLVSLAHEAALSRSVFSARFTEMVGQGAIDYLTQWRIFVAQSLLGGPGLTLSEIAARVGYGSEPAFGRAFKRVLGTAPDVCVRGCGRPDPSGAGGCHRRCGHQGPPPGVLSPRTRGPARGRGPSWLRARPEQQRE